MSRPLCRCCGKPIAKWTDRVYVYNKEPMHKPVSGRYFVGEYRTKAEVQKLVNQQVTAVEYHQHDGSWGKAGTVWSFTTWDGESYIPRAGFFCTGTCAQAFAQMAAKGGLQTRAYASALSKQLEREGNLVTMKVKDHEAA